MAARADRAILKRQQAEQRHERMVDQGVEHFKVKQKALWENRLEDVIRTNKVKTNENNLEAQQKSSLQERRVRLATMLSEEQKAYEQELVDMEQTPAQRMEKMSERAYDLKRRREDERKAVVQEKLYQQWREGCDELRTQDSEIVQLKTISQRDHQLREKALAREEEKEHERVYDQLWYEGYLAKGEREIREKALKLERRDQMKAVLEMQLARKEKRVQEDSAQEKYEVSELKKLWDVQEQEATEAVVKEKILAKEERKKADAYAAIQKAQRDEAQVLEDADDKAFVKAVLEREQALAEKEEAEKAKAKKKAVEYTEALKIEMAKKAESEERLIQLQCEEAERQHKKQYAQWEKEELARRALLEEVYQDRADQVRLKQGMRENLKAELARERDQMDVEVHRLDAIGMERDEAEQIVSKRLQEELFQQMDFKQLQRHRQLEQNALEQRQAKMEQEKIAQAMEIEKDKAKNIMAEVLRERAEQQKKDKQQRSLAPWEK